ncbi:hypothetical protein ACTVLR_00215 [Serratia ureilytica]|uniref:hypothetical protein n=1 Tax=Serratia ureilytica TaxID=300181 RepID=UPI003FA71C36
MDKFSELKDALEFLETTEFDGEWDSALVGGENGKNYHAVINANDVVVRAADDSRHTSWLCDYLEAVSPVKIRAMLAELEAKAMECRGIEQERELFRIERTAHQQHAQELERRVAELEQLPTIKHMRSVEEALIRATDMVSELEAKLATPVRLPDIRQSSSGDRYQWSDGAHNYRLDVISMLLGAGFTVAVEGVE